MADQPGSSSPAPASGGGGSSAPAPSSSPAPAAQPAAAAVPAAQPAPDAKQFEGKSVLESVRQISKDTIAAAAADKPPAVAAPAPAAPAHAAAQPPAAEKTDPPATEKKEDEIDPAAPPADDEFALPEEELALEQLGILTPMALAAKAKEMPELDAFLNANPQLKGELMYTLRKGAELGKIAALGITSERQAKFHIGQTQLMSDIEGSLTTLGEKGDDGRDGYMKLLGIMGTLDLVRDDETGEPMKDAAGNFQTHGFAAQFLQRNAVELINSLEQAAEADDDPTLLAAVKTVKERITRSSSVSDEGLPEHLKAEREQIRQDREKVEAEKASGKLEKRRAVETTVRDGALKDLNGSIEAFFGPGKAALEPFSKDVVVNRARTAFYAKLESDRVYRNQRDYLVSQPQTKAVLDERKALIRDAIATYLPGVMREELKRAGVGKKAQQEAADKQRSAQEAGSRHEIKGGGAAPVPGAEEAPEVAQAKLEADFVRTTGRKPTMRELVSLVAKANRRPGA